MSNEPPPLSTIACDVAVLVGSLRRASITRRLAEGLIRLKPALSMRMVDIRNLPLYDPDLEDEGPPLPWIEFRRTVSAARTVLFVTPEYNRSIPGALKNAIDVGSRPYGRSVWAGKPAAVVSASPGGMGGFGANHHLRQCLVTLDMPTLQQPEMYIAHVDRLFPPEPDAMNEATAALLQPFMDGFEAWVARLAAREQP